MNDPNHHDHHQELKEDGGCPQSIGRFLTIFQLSTSISMSINTNFRFGIGISCIININISINNNNSKNNNTELSTDELWLVYISTSIIYNYFIFIASEVRIACMSYRTFPGSKFIIIFGSI